MTNVVAKINFLIILPPSKISYLIKGFKYKTKKMYINILKLLNNLNYYTKNIEKTKSNYKWKKFAYELEKFIYNL